MATLRRRVYLVALLIAASWLGIGGALLVALGLLFGPGLTWLEVGGVMLAAAAEAGLLVWRRLA